jgi:NAD(P)-dependent dehydrogenase (short-subunit alcohol dehydrogenase family)
MTPLPKSEDDDYRPSAKLQDKIAIITGGDSGIGRAVSILFAKEGADVVIVYLDEHEDARDTQQRIEKTGRRCLCLSGDVGDPVFCREVVEKTVATFGKIDILINNAAEQHDYDSILDITPDQLKRTFDTNIFSMFYMIQSAYSYLKNGGVIVNSTSVTAYQGHPTLIPYACTKGAITGFLPDHSL